MKASASHRGSSERVGRNVLEHLGEQLHPVEDHARSLEAAQIEPQQLQDTPGTSAGVTGRLQSPQENIPVAPKDGIARASSVAPKFASELARLVAAVDAAGARDAVRGTGLETNPLPLDDLYDEELDVQDLVAGAEPIVSASASSEIVDLDAIASDGEGAMWSHPTQEANPDVPAPTVLAVSGPYQGEVTFRQASVTRTAPAVATAPVARAVSTSDHNPPVVVSGAATIGPATFEFSSPSEPMAEAATSAGSSTVVPAPPRVFPLGESLTRSVTSPTSPAVVDPPVSEGLPAHGPSTPPAAVEARVLPAVPEIREGADAVRVSSPPQTSVHASILRPVSMDAAHPSVGPLPALPVPERTSTQTPAEAPKHKAQDHSPAAFLPKAPALPSIGPRGGPASPVMVSPFTIGGHVSHVPSTKTSAHAPGGEGPARVRGEVRGELAVLVTAAGVSSVATPVLVTQANAESPTGAPQIAWAASVQMPDAAPRKASLLIAPPTTKAVAQPRSGSVAAVPPPMKGIDFPSAGSRRDVTSRQADLPTIAPVAHPTVVSQVAVVRSEACAPSVPLKVTSQALEVEHISRHRVAVRSAARGPAQPRRPEAPTVLTAASSEQTQPAPVAQTSAPVAQTSAPVAQTSAPVAHARPAGSQGRFKLPALIPTDSGLRMASLQRPVSPAAHPTPPADTNTHPPIPPLASPGPDFRRVRAAVLDLVQRADSEGSLASTVSRKGIDTPLGFDKSESSARRAPRPLNGGQGGHGDSSSGERPLFFAPPLPAATASSPSPHDVTPVGQRRGTRDENATIGTRRPAVASATAPHAHTVVPTAATVLAAPAQPRAPKFSHEAGSARIADATKASGPALPSQATTELPEGSHVDRNAAAALASHSAHEAPVARATATPSAHIPAPAASHELRAADLSLPAGSAAPRALLDQAAADPSLHAAAIGNNAHLRLETAHAGSLSLHVRVHDGVADLEVEGAGASSLDFRPQEIRRALAGEGLTLGHFETRNREGDAVRIPDAAVSSASASAHTGGSSDGTSGSSNPNDGLPPPPLENPRGAAGAFSSNSTPSSFGDGRRSWNSDGSDGRDHDQHAGSGDGQTPATPSTSGPRRRRGFHVMA